MSCYEDIIIDKCKLCKYSRKSNHCTFYENEAEDRECPVLTKKRTVSFKDLLNTTPIDDVLALFPIEGYEKNPDISSYRQVFLQLRDVPYVLNESYICLTRKFSSDGYSYIDTVYIPWFHKDNDTRYGMEFLRNEIVGMQIHPDTLRNFDAATIIAHCLEEVTFFGFDPKSGKREMDYIKALRNSI